MDNVIKRIIEIDNKTLAVRESIQEMLKNNELRLKKSMAEMETHILDSARETGQTIHQRFVREAQLEEQKILQQAHRECKVMEQIFSIIHQELEKDLFEQIFLK